MEKRILIPTDFTIESLNVLKSVLKSLDAELKYHIVLLHGVHSSDSITDLIFQSKGRLIQKLSSVDFEEACEVIKNKFDSQIITIRKELFFGFTQTAFDNFIEGSKVDVAYIPLGFKFKLTNKSFDIVPFIQRSKLVVNEINWSSPNTIPEKGSIAGVFFNELSPN